MDAQKILTAEGISTTVQAYAAWAGGVDCPVSDRLAAEALSLPMRVYLDEATQARVVVALARAARP